MMRAFKWMLWGVAGLFVLALFRGAPPPETVVIEPALTVEQSGFATGNRLQSNGVGCRDHADVVAIQAGTETIDTSVRGGKCRLLFAGARVDIHERDAGLLKIGLNGVGSDQEALWTSEAVMKPAPADAVSPPLKKVPDEVASRPAKMTPPPRAAVADRSARLHGESTGIEWRKATADDRDGWAVTVAQRLEADQARALVLAIGLRACLDAAVRGATPAEERQLHPVLASISLTDMTAVCAIGLGHE